MLRELSFNALLTDGTASKSTSNPCVMRKGVGERSSGSINPPPRSADPPSCSSSRTPRSYDECVWFREVVVRFPESAVLFRSAAVSFTDISENFVGPSVLLREEYASRQWSCCRYQRKSRTLRRASRPNGMVDGLDFG